MRDMSNTVGNVDDLRAARDARKNPPMYEAGQGSDDEYSFFDDDSGSGDSAWGTMDDNAFKGSNGDMGLTSFDSGMNALSTQVQSQPKVTTTDEDKMWEIIMKILKTVKNLFKIGANASQEIVLGVKSASQDKNAFFWSTYGSRLFWTGIGILAASVIAGILSLFVDYFSNAFWMGIGGALLTSIGALFLGLNFDRSKELRESQENRGNDTDLAVVEEADDEGEEEIDVFEDDVFNDEDEGDFPAWGTDDDEDGVEEDGDLSFSAWDSLSEDADEVGDNAVYEEDINFESAAENIREIPAHTQTRRYLYEEFCKILPNKNPAFAHLKSIPDTDSNFIAFDKILADASIQMGMKEDKIPELLDLRENQFIIQLRATRPSGLKEEDVAREIANMYSRNDSGMVEVEGVYATTSSVGSKYIVNIFKGEDSLVTLADTYKVEEDFILNPSVKKPVVMGVSEFGKVWKFDAEKVYSYIFSGKPRTGKSWAVVALIVQLAMYSPPSEVEFEALDVKNSSSDYYKMNKLIPHFVNFEGNPQKILSRLRYLTTTEATRRQKILKEYEVLNVADLKASGAEVKLPYRYVIIDEILGLKAVLSKEENEEFKNLVNAIVTQMPNLGFRVILVPHRVTNDVISKTTYTNIGCIACVKSDFKEINTTLEVSKKEFPYSLPNTGDMALKSSELNRGIPVFSHGIAITSSNEGNEGVYKFIGKLWSLLEPETANEDNSNKKEEKSGGYEGHSLDFERVTKESINNTEGVDDALEDFWDEVIRD